MFVQPNEARARDFFDLAYGNKATFTFELESGKQGSGFWIMEDDDDELEGEFEIEDESYGTVGGNWELERD